jgi:hypothetical protein
MRPDSGQRSGAVGGGERGQTKIVCGGPEPEAVFMHHVTPHSDHDLVLARDAYVAGRILRHPRNLYMLASKTAGEITDSHGMIQFEVNGKRMCMKNRRLNQHHGGHWGMDAQQLAQVRGDATFGSLQ